MRTRSGLGSKDAIPRSDIDTTAYLTAFKSDLMPVCVVEPASKEELAETPFTGYGECHSAIRTSGNQPCAGTINIAGGAAIDLRSPADI